MSVEKNRDEANRWMTTARGDIESARILLANRRYAHACFHAQQAAEKSLKAAWYLQDADPWGHSVRRLIESLNEINSALHSALKPLSEKGAKLDRYHIPTRYPNGLPELSPDQAYFEEDAREAVASAGEIIGCVERLLDG